MVTTKYVKNKIEKATGKEMKDNREGQEEVYKLWLEHEEEVMTVMSQDGEAISVHTRRVGDKPDPMTDYFPGVYWKNVTQMLAGLGLMKE